VAIGVAGFVAELPENHVLGLRATEIALQHLGRPLPNTVLLGGFAALTGAVSLAAVVTAIEDRFSGAMREGNVAAATEAFNLTRGMVGTWATRERSAVGAPPD
jgi:pyruvate ferredoxin oxidoreductase gamma subunit